MADKPKAKRSLKTATDSEIAAAKDIKGTVLSTTAFSIPGEVFDALPITKHFVDGVQVYPTSTNDLISMEMPRADPKPVCECHAGAPSIHCCHSCHKCPSCCPCKDCPCGVCRSARIRKALA